MGPPPGVVPTPWQQPPPGAQFTPRPPFTGPPQQFGPPPQPQFGPPSQPFPQPPPVTPRPPFTPPGSFPQPGAAQSPPGVASMPQATPGFPPDLRYAPPPAKKSSLLGLWMVIGAVVVIAGVAIGMYYKRKEEKPKNLLEQLQDLDIEVPAPVPTEMYPPSPGKQIDPPSGSNRYHAAGGFDHYIDFPDDFTFGEQTPGRAVATGELGDLTVLVTANAMAVDGSTVTQAMLSEAADAIPISDGGTLVEKRTRRVRGEQLVSVIYDVPAQSLRVESVIYPRPKSIVAVSFGVTKDDFADTVGFRDDLFGRRVGFDSQ